MTQTARPDGEPIRVFLLFNDPASRARMRELLTGAGMEVVGEGDSAPDGVRRIARLRPDVAVVGMRLPGGGGSLAARAVPAETVCLLMVPGEDGEVERPAATATLIDGYLRTDTSDTSLVDAVRRAVTRATQADSER